MPRVLEKICILCKFIASERMTVSCRKLRERLRVLLIMLNDQFGLISALCALPQKVVYVLFGFSEDLWDKNHALLCFFLNIKYFFRLTNG